MRFSQCGNLLFVFLGLESRLCGAVFLLALTSFRCEADVVP